MSSKENKKERNEEEFEAVSYTLFPKERVKIFSSENAKDVEQLGKLREVEIFETEHHVYTVPFRYKNVKVDNWLEYNDKGIEMAADIGSITITEEKPIISVTIAGSGCSSPCYNIVEWWGPGESIHKMSENKAGQLIKRQRIDNLKGQHNAWVQHALTQEPPEFKSIEEAKEYLKRIRMTVYYMTSGYYMPGSLMSGLYENTACFRIGDTSRPEHTAYKIVIRGGCLDYEDPGTMFTPSKARYPAEYSFRLIDVVVKKSVS